MKHTLIYCDALFCGIFLCYAGSVGTNPNKLIIAANPSHVCSIPKRTPPATIIHPLQTNYWNMSSYSQIEICCNLYIEKYRCGTKGALANRPFLLRGPIRTFCLKGWPSTARIQHRADQKDHCTCLIKVWLLIGSHINQSTVKKSSTVFQWADRQTHGHAG